MYLSIILPYFKKKKYIKQTLNSIINQSFKNHELIIIYDQIDRSDISYIKKIIKNKIKYKIIINKKNLGVGKSRNIGIKNSKSKYIAFCDADDVWHKKKSEVQLNLMREKKISFSHTDYNLINNRNKIIGEMVVKKTLSYNDLLRSCDIALSSVILKRSLLIESLKFGDTKTKEDFFLWLKISKREVIHGINKKLINWRKTENSLSSDIIQKLIDAFIVFDKVEKQNFFITFYYVIRLSIYYIFKKIKQKKYL